jgi:hypothetical protein
MTVNRKPASAREKAARKIRAAASRAASANPGATAQVAALKRRRSHRFPHLPPIRRPRARLPSAAPSRRDRSRRHRSRQIIPIFRHSCCGRSARASERRILAIANDAATVYGSFINVH